MFVSLLVEACFLLLLLIFIPTPCNQTVSLVNKLYHCFVAQVDERLIHYSGCKVVSKSNVSVLCGVCGIYVFSSVRHAKDCCSVGIYYHGALQVGITIIFMHISYPCAMQGFIVRGIVGVVGHLFVK